MNKATLSPEIFRKQVKNPTHFFLIAYNAKKHEMRQHCFSKKNQGNEGYIGYRFPLSLSTIWGNHLPFNFMLKFPIYYLEKPPPI